MGIRAAAEVLCQKHDSRNPFDLAESLGIIVLHEPLGEINGYYNKVYKQQFIHINQSLPGEEACFTCAHELAHAVLHPTLNTPFLRKNTLFSVDRLETDANRFALEVIYSDEELQFLLPRSVTDAATYMGVPLSLAEYRMRTVQPNLYCFLE